MGINSRALFQCLQADLEAHFSVSSIDKIRDWECIDAKASCSLIDSFFKKFQDEPIEGFEAEALKNFIFLNEKMKCFDVTLQTSGDELLYNVFVDIYNDFFNRAMDENRYWWTLDECFHHGRPGPGSSINANGSDFYTKLFSSKMSTTSLGLYQHYVGELTSVPLLASANFRREQDYGQVEVAGNRLSFVPKTRLIARTICTEPNLNMFYQLGLGCMIERELRYRFGIDMSLQPDHNRQLARLGSIDGSFCTIDLSSASDTISWRLIQKITRNHAVLGLFSVLRSPRSILPTGESLELQMVSTMGNGFTFPLQTLLFTCALSSVFQSFGWLPNNWHKTKRNFGVFGDDIVLPNFMFERMCHLLKLLGFTVNEDKSFSRGAFRESCGRDFYRGHDVRGVYLKSLKHPTDRYSAINRLNRWSASHNIALSRTVGLLLENVRFLPVPPFEQDDAGVQCPLYIAKGYIHYDRNWSFVYKALVPLPSQLRIVGDKIVVPRRGKKRAFNYEGLLHTFLHGSLRNHKMTVRQDRPCYGYKARRCPTWDYLPNERFQFRNARRLPWDMAVAWNLLVTEDSRLAPQV